MSRYDGLIIPRSYSEYINKTDAATLLQALQQSGVMDAAPTSGSNHPVKSGGVKTAINNITPVDNITSGQSKPPTSNAVFFGMTINRFEYIVPANGSKKTNYLCAPGGGAGALLVMASLSFADGNSTAAYIGFLRLSFGSGTITKVDIAESTDNAQYYKISEKLTFSDQSGYVTINNAMGVEVNVAIIPNRLSLYRTS